MYHAIVRAKVRRLWERVGAGDHLAAVELAAADVRFKFVGEPPLGAEFTGRDRFERWFRVVHENLPVCASRSPMSWCGGGLGARPS